ncbi:hypothetical protein HBI04_171720 [Parastagonospora nodorum]|nr:hypothetical protein HBH42_154760 [Parastagonospora nodorum]KAH4260357.1 hypothetical protein HBI03_123290 [Parastagonospora nodorum]KAH4267123.1 hypothetical protein HBI04_171720 [Parastagonospora nodorum]KAH6131715.1 hypothetical protein HBI64_096950 [Parastagonospora nodorum]KAH6500697.1 hypothetical protein HBI55_060570 [Parastagonospora nodorum]
MLLGVLHRVLFKTASLPRTLTDTTSSTNLPTITASGTRNISVVRGLPATFVLAPDFSVRTLDNLVQSPRQRFTLELVASSHISEVSVYSNGFKMLSREVESWN